MTRPVISDFPDQRHRGEDIDLLARRHALYEAAKAQHPERWSGATCNWEPVTTVFLNPGKPLEAERQTRPTAARPVRQLP